MKTTSYMLHINLLFFNKKYSCPFISYIQELNSPLWLVGTISDSADYIQGTLSAQNTRLSKASISVSFLPFSDEISVKHGLQGEVWQTPFYSQNLSKSWFEMDLLGWWLTSLIF